MKTLERTINELFFKCKKCGRVRKPVEFDDVQEERKDSVKKMMEAMDPILQSNDEISAFIVYCKHCNEFSTVLIHGDC